MLRSPLYEIVHDYAIMGEESQENISRYNYENEGCQRNI